ncbi:hypothetical protein MTO96_002366 [Rhipicephalus appendiculatus]
MATSLTHQVETSCIRVQTPTVHRLVHTQLPRRLDGRYCWRHNALGHQLAVATSAAVVVRAVLVPHLASALPASELASLDESGVPVGTNDAVVQLGAVDVTHGVLGVGARVVLDEAEAARRLVEAVQPHDHLLDVAALGEELVDLFLGRVEGHVADVERRAQPEQPFLLRSAAP